MQTINIANLKAKLSEIIRRVRQGESFTVLDRNTPVASLVVYRSSDLKIFAPAQKRVAAPQGISLKNRTDSIQILRADRERR